MIYHLLYISEKSKNFDEKNDLEKILQSSHIHNEKYNITGVLITRNQFFIQVLEGKKEDVETTFNRITPDSRHKKVKTLLTYQDQSRIFPNWVMGIVQGEQFASNINELIPLLHKQTLILPNVRDRVIALLKNFNKV